MQRSQRARARLTAFAALRGDDVLLWCQLPRLLSATNRVLEPHAVPAPLPRRELQAPRSLRASWHKRTMPAGVPVSLAGRCLLLAGDAGQRRAQAPLRERFGPLRPCEPARLPPGRTRRRLRQASELASDLIAFGASERLELPIDSAGLHRGLLRTARLLEGWERLLARESPGVVLVGSLWQTPARALVYAARQAGIPSVYVPHRPQRSEAHPIDLAVGYAGLRGDGEVEFLAGHGMDRQRLDVVGDPSTVLEPPPEIDPSSPAVFAPSSEDPRMLAPMIELVHEALGSGVVVGRHPAAGDGASAFPRQWPIFPARTRELLKRGSPVVLQQSSGVALESMQVGIPVIELQFPGQAPTFPLIREPYVRFASSSAQLATAAAASLADARDSSRRERLIAWARHWAWPTGAEAAARLVALVEDAIDRGPREPIWDSVGLIGCSPEARL